MKLRRILCICLTLASAARAEDAQLYFEAGQRAAKAGDALTSYLMYSRAVQLAPGNAAYAAQTRTAPSIAVQTGPPPEVLHDSANETIEGALIERGLIGESPAAESVPHLTPKEGRQDYDLRGDARTVIESALRQMGLQAAFDPAYQPLPQVQFRLKDADPHEALRVLSTITDSFFVTINATILLTARDTAPKRTEWTPNVSIAVPIPERITVQEAQEMLTGVQQTLEVRRVSLDAAKRLAIFRDTTAKVYAARQMFLSLSRPHAQVQVDVEFLSLGRTSALNYGLSLPTASNIVDFSSFLNNPTPAAGNYFAFGGGATYIGLGIANSQIFGTLAKTSTQLMMHSTIVTLDSQPGSLTVGSRYPVTSGNFTQVTGSLAGGAATPTIRFEDLGFSIKITPTVHADQEVTLDVDSQFKTLGAGSVNGIPVISSRQYQGKVRLREGEWGVVAGLITLAPAVTRTGIAGVSQIPLVGEALRRNIKELIETQILIVLKPRVTVLPAWETLTPGLWLGSETKQQTVF